MGEGASVRKRGRPSGTSNRGRKRADGEGGDDDDEPSSKKRRGPRSLNFDKMSGSVSVNPQAKRKMKKILDIVLKYTDAEGRMLSQPFMKLPTRKELPDYYEVIKKPIDIYKIFQRIRADKYMEVEELERDFIQLCKNAQNYNEETSLIYEDSVVLQSIFTSARQRVEAEPDEPIEEQPVAEDDDGNNMPSESDDNSNMASNTSSAVKVKIKIGRGRGGVGAGAGAGRGKRKRSSRKYVSDDDDEFGEDEEGASERTSSRSSSRVASPAPSRRTR